MHQGWEEGRKPGGAGVVWPRAGMSKYWRMCWHWSELVTSVESRAGRWSGLQCHVSRHPEEMIGVSQRQIMINQLEKSTCYGKTQDKDSHDSRLLKEYGT